MGLRGKEKHNKANVSPYIYIYCRDTFCSPSPNCQGYWLSEQYNKFVKSGSKNQVLMNLTTASMDLEDDQVRTRNIELNEFTVRGGKFSH